MSKLRKKTLSSKIATQQLEENTGLAAEAMDAFTNVAARMGYGTSSLAEATEYELVRWTNNYWLMITLFRNHWISRRIVEKPAQDMCKAWPVINSTELKPDQINDFKRTIDRTYTPHRIREAITWARLFGGAGALIVIDGHEGMLDKPLRLDDVNPGSYKGLIVFDRWSGITPSTQMCDDINSPVDFNLPEYYTVQGEDQSSFNVHHSRILRFCGPQVPRPENQVQMHWGISELEIAYEEIRKRDNASWSILSLMFRAQILAQKNPALAQLLAGTGASKTALAQFQKVMQAQNELMSNQSMLLMGADSDLQGHSYSFAGISEVYQQFQMDISGSAKMPVSILFGRTVTGLSQGNDADIRIYEQDIAQKQHEELRPQLDKLYPVICMSEFGEVPDDLDMTFPSIRVLTEEQKTENAAKITEAVLKPYEAGITGPRLTLQELQAQSEVTGIFTNITPEMIEKASEEPVQPMLGMEGEGDNEGGEGNDAEFNESDHPRDESGKFGSGGSKGVSEFLKNAKPNSWGRIDNPLKRSSSKEQDAEEVAFYGLGAKKGEALIASTAPIEIDPSELESSQDNISDSGLEFFGEHPEEINKPHADGVFFDDAKEQYPVAIQTPKGLKLQNGNHRAAAAMLLGKKLKVHVLTRKDIIKAMLTK